MELYFKITAGILITMVLCLLLPKQKADISVLLCLAVCCMTLICAAVYLEPILTLLHRLIDLGNLPNDLIEILFKIMGIGLISQIASVLCMDAGNQSLGKVLQLITTVVVVWLCIPLLEQLLVLIENVLGVS